MCEESRDLAIFTPAVDIAFKAMWIFIFIAGVLFAVVRWTQPSEQLLLEELIKIVTALFAGIICTIAGVRKQGQVNSGRASCFFPIAMDTEVRFWLDYEMLEVLCRHEQGVAAQRIVDANYSPVPNSSRTYPERVAAIPSPPFDATLSGLIIFPPPIYRGSAATPASVTESRWDSFQDPAIKLDFQWR